MSEFKQYRRTQIAELREYEPGEMLSDRVSVSLADFKNGSPQAGDMIARNPKNHEDQWLVAADYFGDNFEEVSEASVLDDFVAYVVDRGENIWWLDGHLEAFLESRNGGPT